MISNKEKPIEYKCGECVWLNTKYDGKSCADAGVTKWDHPCKPTHWTPIARPFTGELAEIQTVLAKLDRRSLPVVEWMIQKLRGLEDAEKETGYRIGQKIMVKVGEKQWTPGTIEELQISKTSPKKVYIGGLTDAGANFLVPKESTDVYKQQEA